jgi:hypothetical protein
MKKKLPKDNELPDSIYEAKKVLYPLGLEVQKIHACINNCILYHGEEYENLEACPVCTALRYKIRRDDPGDVDGEYTWAFSRAGPGRRKARYKKSLPRPDSTVGPKFSAQARPMEAVFCRVFEPSCRAFIKSHVFLAQARPS